MEEELILKADEALDYVRNNVEIFDVLELSYNRVFVPAEVIDIDKDTENSLKLMLQMNGEIINDTVELDLVEVKDELLEIRHIRDDKLTIIVVE
ncbi:MAG: DUF2097 domain-containing protein [Methanobacterium sp.]|jgi:hypothetical protein